jgi:hypothetical protein
LVALALAEPARSQVAGLSAAGSARPFMASAPPP